jgi:ABC-2 type transport system permease protein
MTALTWRTFPVLALTVRQFLGGKAVRVVTALAFVPCIFAGIYLLNPDVDRPSRFLVRVIFLGVVVPTMLPITTLILATAALGNEVEDRTLPYLTLKPIGRLRIVIEKFAGILVVVLPAVTAGLIATYLLVARGAADDLLRLLWATIAAGAAATVAFAAIFLFISLIIPRALLVGIIYSFVWESLLGRYLPGTYFVSVHHYAESIFKAILDNPSLVRAEKYDTSLSSSLIVLGVTSVVALALATWRLRRMNLE